MASDSRWLGNRLLATLTQAQLDELAGRVRRARQAAAGRGDKVAYNNLESVLERVLEAPGCDSVEAKLEEEAGDYEAQAEQESYMDERGARWALEVQANYMAVRQ